MAYTVAVREKGKSGPFSYITEDLKVADTATRCKPLSREDAEIAKKLFIAGAKKAGRPVECRIVRLCV
jgi:hypothetical protein